MTDELSNLEIKRKWLARHILLKDIDCCLLYSKMSKEMKEQIDRDFKEPINWGWGGKVIEVYIEQGEIWACTDEGRAFMIHENDVLEWPAGIWGPAGSITTKNYI